MTSPCPSQDDLDAFLDERLSGEASSAIESHLSGCEGCSGKVLQRMLHLGEGSSGTTLAALRSLSSAKEPPAPLITPAKPTLAPQGGGALAALTLIAGAFLLGAWLSSPAPATAPPRVARPSPQTAEEPAPEAAEDLGAALEALDARLAERPEAERIALWEGFLARARGTAYEHVASQSLERLRQERLEAARSALRELSNRWLEDGGVTLDPAPALEALAAFEASWPELLTAEREELRGKLEAQRGLPAPRLRHRLHVREGKIVSTPGLDFEVLGKDIIVDRGFLSFESQRQLLQLRLSLEERPERVQLRLILALARLGRLRQATFRLTINGEVVFARWTPYAYEWALYEWDIAEHLQVGENVLELGLSRGFNAIWLRELSIVGR